MLKMWFQDEIFKRKSSYNTKEWLTFTIGEKNTLYLFSFVPKGVQKTFYPGKSMNV